MRRYVFLAAALAAMCVPAAAAKNPGGGPGFDGAKREIYKTVGDVKLTIDIFTPPGHKPADKRPSSAKATAGRPAAVFFFGGGWNGGSVRQFAPHCAYLASRGMVAMVADYRVKSRQKTTPFECVKDGKSAVRWIRTNAGRLGVDPKRIAAGGGSAGGHVAAAAGTVPGLEEDGEDRAVSPVPNALLLFNPVYDNGPKGYGYSRVKDRYKEISPMHNIRKGMPPAIVFLGTRDKLIPVATAKAFQAKMEAVGSRSELRLYEGQGHGFFNARAFRKKKGVSEYYVKTVRQMDLFLASLGWLEGEPTLGKDAGAAADKAGSR